MNGFISILVIVIDIIAILSVLQSPLPNAKKFLWLILILVLPFIGVLLYFLIGNKKS